MKYSESLLSEDELIIFDVHHHPVVLYGRGFLCLFFLLLWIGLVSSVANFREPWVVLGCSVLFIVLLVLLGLKALSWSRINFVLTNERLIYRSGIMSKQSHETPLSRVSDVSTSQLIIDRLLGYGDLIIELTEKEPLVLFRMPDPENLKAQILKQVNINSSRSGNDQREVLARDVARELNKIQPTREIETIPPEREPFYSEIVNQLERLGNLQKDGVITEEEFLKAKEGLLRRLDERQ